MLWLILVAFFLLFISWTTKKIEKIVGIATFLCLVFGLLLGYFHQTPSLNAIQSFSELPLVFFLFVDGIRLHVPKIVHYHGEALKQITLGFFIQSFLGAILAHFFLDLLWTSSILLALVCAVIDLKATPLPMKTKGLPKRVTQILNIEAAATSIIAVFLFMFVKEKSLLECIFPILVGIGFGLFVIYFTRLTLKWNLADRFFLISNLFIAPFCLFYLLGFFHLNGYIGVIALALTVGHVGRQLCDGIFDLSRRQGHLFFFLFMLLFSSQILSPLTNFLTFPMAFYAFFSLFIIRFIGIFISFFGSQFCWQTVIFCTFFGPRALVPAALSLLFFPYESVVYTAFSGIFVLSIFLHTVLSFAVTYWYRKKVTQVGELEYLPTIYFPF